MQFNVLGWVVQFATHCCSYPHNQKIASLFVVSTCRSPGILVEKIFQRSRGTIDICGSLTRLNTNKALQGILLCVRFNVHRSMSLWWVLLLWWLPNNILPTGHTPHLPRKRRQSYLNVSSELYCLTTMSECNVDCPAFYNKVAQLDLRQQRFL